MWGFPLLIPHLFFLVQIWGYGKPQLEKWKNLIVGWKPQTIEKRECGEVSIQPKTPFNLLYCFLRQFFNYPNINSQLQLISNYNSNRVSCVRSFYNNREYLFFLEVQFYYLQRFKIYC